MESPRGRRLVRGPLKAFYLRTVAIVLLLAGCRSLDAETAEATICSTEPCVRHLECPTGLLFQAGDNRLRYFEGDRSTFSDCRRALTEAGLAKIEYSPCDENEISENCLEAAVVSVDGASSLKPVTFREIPAQRLFVRCAEQRMRVKEVRGNGNRYQVTLATDVDENDGLQKVRALCHVQLSRKTVDTQVVRFVCRDNGSWKSCDDKGSQ